VPLLPSILDLQVKTFPCGLATLAPSALCPSWRHREAFQLRFAAPFLQPSRGRALGGFDGGVWLLCFLSFALYIC
jgi:hypothetical protein